LFFENLVKSAILALLKNKVTPISNLGSFNSGEMSKVTRFCNENGSHTPKYHIHT